MIEIDPNHPMMVRLDRRINGNPLGLQYAQERAGPIFEEIKPLLHAHFEEIAHYKDIELKPDYGRYFEAEHHGHLRIYTARADDVLIGYAIYFVRRSLHYRDSLQAQQDILYLAPKHRSGGRGRALIEYADACLCQEGVQVVIQHVKHKRELNFGPLLKRIGYELMDELWTRRLD